MEIIVYTAIENMRSHTHLGHHVPFDASNIITKISYKHKKEITPRDQVF